MSEHGWKALILAVFQFWTFINDLCALPALLCFNLLAATLKSFKIKELRRKAVSAREKPAKVSEETDLPSDLRRPPDFQPALSAFSESVF